MDPRADFELSFGQVKRFQKNGHAVLRNVSSRGEKKSLPTSCIAAAATRAADEIAAYCEKEKRQELKLKETRLSQAVLQQRIEVAQKDSNLILSEEAAKREGQGTAAGALQHAGVPRQALLRLLR